MKCPYRNFEDCLVEECPACNYREKKIKEIIGKYPIEMDQETAMERGLAWEITKTIYEFISCKLAENAVQPIPPKKEITKNITETSVLINKSIF